MVRSVIRTPPWLACPAKTVKTLAPRAAMRSCTAFWAPLPRATIVITAPTPMMMPSMVSTDRSMLARIDCRATATVSPMSMLGPGGSGRCWLLLHPRNSATARYPVDALAGFLLGLNQAGTGKDKDRVGRGYSGHHLRMIQIRETGLNPDRSGASVSLDEDDVPAGPGRCG